MQLVESFIPLETDSWAAIVGAAVKSIQYTGVIDARTSMRSASKSGVQR
jgi:hypothetical protein